jgi:hypothetical protein
MEPHIALQIIEKVVRLMQPVAAEAAAQVSAGAGGGYDKDQKPDEKVWRSMRNMVIGDLHHATLTSMCRSSKGLLLPCGMGRSGVANVLHRRPLLPSLRGHATLYFISWPASRRSFAAGTMLLSAAAAAAAAAAEIFRHCPADNCIILR